MMRADVWICKILKLPGEAACISQARRSTQINQTAQGSLLQEERADAQEMNVGRMTLKKWNLSYIKQMCASRSTESKKN